MTKLIPILLVGLLLNSCSYSRVYFDTYDEANNALPANKKKTIKQVTAEYSPYNGKYELKYKPFN